MSSSSNTCVLVEVFIVFIQIYLLSVIASFALFAALRLNSICFILIGFLVVIVFVLFSITKIQQLFYIPK